MSASVNPTTALSLISSLSTERFGELLKNLSITSTSGNDLTTDDLLCNYDLVRETTNAAIAWYVDNTPLMILYMPCEGGYNNAILDYSGNLNNGTVEGNPTWEEEAGEDGKGALNLDGVNDYLAIGAKTPTGAYTKTARIKWITGRQHNNILSGVDVHAFWVTDYPEVNSLWYLKSGHGGTWNIVQDPSQFTPDVWTTVGVTYDPDVSSGTMILYKNGVAVDTAIGVPGIGADTDLFVGSLGAGNTKFKGLMKDIRVYPRSLSADQMLSIHNNINDPNIKSDETAVDETWKADVTPFTSIKTGKTYQTNVLSIKS